MPKMVSRPELEVYVSEKGYVCIRQYDAEVLPKDAPVVALEPGQVLTVMRWLQDSLPEAERLFKVFVDEPDARD